MIQENPISIRDFSKGRTPEYSVNIANQISNSVSDCLNVDFDTTYGSAKVRKPIQQITRLADIPTGQTLDLTGDITPLGLLLDDYANSSTSNETTPIVHYVFTDKNGKCNYPDFGTPNIPVRMNRIGRWIYACTGDGGIFSQDVNVVPTHSSLYVPTTIWGINESGTWGRTNCPSYISQDVSTFVTGVTADYSYPPFFDASNNIYIPQITSGNLTNYLKYNQAGVAQTFTIPTLPSGYTFGFGDCDGTNIYLPYWKDLGGSTWSNKVYKLNLDGSIVSSDYVTGDALGNNQYRRIQSIRVVHNSTSYQLAGIFNGGHLMVDNVDYVVPTWYGPNVGTNLQNFFNLSNGEIIFPIFYFTNIYTFNGTSVYQYNATGGSIITPATPIITTTVAQNVLSLELSVTANEFYALSQDTIYKLYNSSTSILKTSFVYNMPSGDTLYAINPATMIIYSYTGTTIHKLSAIYRTYLPVRLMIASTKRILAVSPYGGGYSNNNILYVSSAAGSAGYISITNSTIPSPVIDGCIYFFSDTNVLTRYNGLTSNFDILAFTATPADYMSKNTPIYWDLTNASYTDSFWVNLRPEDGDYITAMVDTAAGVIVFKRKHYYIITMSNFGISQMDLFGVGTISQDTTTSARGKVYFYTGTEVMVTDAQSVPQSISRYGIQDFLDKILNPYVSDMSGQEDVKNKIVMYSDDNNIYLSIPRIFGRDILNNVIPQTDVNALDKNSLFGIVCKYRIDDQSWTIYHYDNLPVYTIKFPFKQELLNNLTNQANRYSTNSIMFIGNKNLSLGNNFDYNYGGLFIQGTSYDDSNTLTAGDTYLDVNGDKIYRSIPYYIETQNQEIVRNGLGLMAFEKSFQDHLVVFTQQAKDSNIMYSVNNEDWKRVGVISKNIESLDIKAEGKVIKFRWSGLTTTENTRLDGFYFENVIRKELNQ